MIKRSSIIFAASLAVLSTLEPTLGFAAAAPAHHRDVVERPRFMKREVKRYIPLSNTTTSNGPNLPFGASSSDLERLTSVLTTPPPSVTPKVVPETTPAPAITHTTDQGVIHDEQWSRSQFPQSFQQQSQTPPTTATTPATSLPPSPNSEQPAKSPTTSALDSVTLPATSPPVKSSTEGKATSAVIPTTNTEIIPSPVSLLPTTSSIVKVTTSVILPTASTETNLSPASSPPATSSIVGVPTSAVIPTVKTETNTLPVSSLPATSSIISAPTSPVIPTANTETNASPASSPPATSSIIGVATSAILPTANTKTNPSPASSPPATSSILGVATSAVVPTANTETRVLPASSLPATSSILGEASSAIVSTANTKTNPLPASSLPAIPSISGEPSSVILSTPNTKTSPLPASSLSATSSIVGVATSLTIPSANTEANTLPTTPSVVNTRTEGSASGSSTPAGIISTSSLLRSIVPVTSDTAGRSPSVSAQSLPGQSSAIQSPGHSETVSVAGQSSSPQNTIPVVGSATNGVDKTATGAGTVGTASPESKTSAGIVGGTQSVGELTAPSVTPLSVPPKTQPGVTEQSPTVQTSAPGSSNTPLASIVEHPTLSTGQRSLSGQQTPATSFPLGITTPSVTQEQPLPTATAPVASLTVPSQQPITHPGQTQTNGEGTTSPHATIPPETIGRTSAANSVAPSITASVLPLSGETRSPANTESFTNPDIGVPPRTKTTQDGLLPTLSASVGGSVGVITPVPSLTNGAQPASSPTPVNSGVLPTSVENKPVIPPSAGESSIPVSTMQQGTSKAGGLLPVSQPISVIAVNSGSADGSTPTGSALYSALTDALQKTVGPGSSMLPNGVVVPTASSVIGAVSQAAQQSAATGMQTGVSEQIGTQAQSSGAVPIVPVPSTTLPGGNVVPSPSASAVNSAISNTTPGGSAVLHPSTSADVPAASRILPVESVGISPLASTAVSGGSTTSPGGSVVPITSASGVAPVASVIPPGGTVISSPLVSDTVATHGGVSGVASAASVTESGPQRPAATVSDTALPPIISPSVTPSRGSVNQNPTATILSSGVLSQSDESKSPHPVSDTLGVVASSLPIPATSSLHAGLNSPSSGSHGSSVIDSAISNTLQSSGAQPQTLPANSNGVVLSAQTSASGSTGASKTGSLALANGESSTSGVATASVSSVVPTSTPPAIVGSVPNSKGEVLPTTTGQVSGSATVSGGSVIPLNAVTSTAGSGTSPIVVGSATNSNGAALPITAGQTTGSATVSGGSVIPLIAATSTAGSASSPIIIGSTTNSNGVALPITAGQVTGSSTLSGGSVVPIHASAPTAAPASGSLTSASTGSGSDKASGIITLIAESSQATGGATEPNGSGVFASQTALSAPAPVTGTVTGPPSAAGTSSAQVPGQHYPTSANGPITQQPASYDTATIQTVPTSILAYSSSMPPSQTSSYASTSLPTTWPLILYPPNGVVKQPVDTELIQIGFLYPLNYEFVLQHDDSQKQIFKYLPMGIAFGLQIDIANVTMQTLRAFDTRPDRHYVTTLALAFVPRSQVDALGLLVHTPTSKFYRTPDNSTNTLLSMINISLPIAADNRTDGGSSVSGASPSSTATMNDGGAPVGGGIGSSNPVRASSVGIGVGVACGAAVYGAAMFFVARRYKKRRQSHLRSPSMFSSPVMSHVGPDAGAGAALMSGGMGDHRSPSPYHDNAGRAGSRGSGRSGSTGRQQISAPVMAENSLGWN